MLTQHGHFACGCSTIRPTRRCSRTLANNSKPNVQLPYGLFRSSGLGVRGRRASCTTNEKLGVVAEERDDNSAESSSVEEALQKAEEAAEKAAAAVTEVENLPSAYRAPWFVRAAFGFFSRFSTFSLIGVFMVSHYLGTIAQFCGGCMGAIVISLFAYKRQSLNPSGAIAAWIVGFMTMGSSLRCGVTLLAFFFSASKLTKLKQDVKMRFDGEYKVGGQRDWVQVLCNGGLPAVLAVVSGWLVGFKDVPFTTTPEAKLVNALLAAFLGYYACCCGDSWASEVGVLSRDTPRLITSMRPVRRGTNGGVTLLGLSASIAGGLFVGLAFFLATALSPAVWAYPKGLASQWPLIVMGLAGGLIGSVIDSILGATLQFSGFDMKLQKVVNRVGHPDTVLHISGMNILTNNQVNLVSATLTACLMAKLVLVVY